MTQLGFDDLLETAAQDNAERIFAKETAHLPENFADAVRFFEAFIRDHDQAMRDAKVDDVMRLREEAHLLAKKLNGGNPGILAHDNAPAYRLERAFAPEAGHEPLWGQHGKFIVCIEGMQVEVDLHGIFGIGGCYHFWPGFAARAVDHAKPFLSQTGYRSFLGIHAEPQAGLSPIRFVEIVIQGYIDNELKGHLLKIDEQYRD